MEWAPGEGGIKSGGAMLMEMAKTSFIGDTDNATMEREAQMLLGLTATGERMKGARSFE